jgi:hypothetical protein
MYHCIQENLLKNTPSNGGIFLTYLYNLVYSKYENQHLKIARNLQINFH